MLQRLLLLLVATWMIAGTAIAQLKPGFDKSEYLAMAKITARFGDSSYFEQIPAPEDYHFVYRSSVSGLDNCWDLWISDQSVAVISIRGTTANSISWLANFYAAMVPAKGTLKLNGHDSFVYECAKDPRAAVHTGWLISTGFLAKDVVSKIDSCYQAGIRNFIITGHSQGGAIAYLLTSYLYHRQRNQELPQDIRMKTYCSAAPKPGNLQFAYEYEMLTQGGWAYNVVNSADWVPEVPVSVQTVDDMARINPFMHARQAIRQQKFPKNIALRRMYNQLDKPARKTQRNYQKYFGKYTSGLVRKSLHELIPPVYYNSNHYVRTGNIVVLFADDAYYKVFPDDPQKTFRHHLHPAYLYLAEKLPASLPDQSGQGLHSEPGH